MRLLLFVSALAILVSLGVLIAVIIKAKRDEEKQRSSHEPPPLR
jgi:hypothetical protein